MSGKEILKRRADAATEALKSPRVRWVTGRAQVKVEIDERKYQQAVDKIMNDEIERHLITGAIKEKGPLTIGEISKITELKSNRVMEHIIALRKRGIVGEAGEKDESYVYNLL